jgi:hypothetical protein
MVRRWRRRDPGGRVRARQSRCQTMRGVKTCALLVVMVLMVPAGAWAACCRCNGCPTGVPCFMTGFVEAQDCFDMLCPAGCGDAVSNSALPCSVFPGDCTTIDGVPVPSRTPTTTVTATQTPTATPVPEGGMCVETAQCEVPFSCIDGVCSAIPALAPTLQPLSVIAGLGLLAAIAALGLRRRKQ